MQLALLDGTPVRQALSDNTVIPREILAYSNYAISLLESDAACVNCKALLVGTVFSR